MPSVKVKEGETFEVAMRRFKRIVDKTRIPQDAKAREFHVSGSVKKQRKKAAAKKRLAKRLAREKTSFRDLARSNWNSGERKKSKFRHKEDRPNAGKAWLG